MKCIPITAKSFPVRDRKRSNGDRFFSRGFWNRQKPEVQEHLLAAWKDAVTWGRANARLREQEAMKLAEEKGIKVFRPRQEDLDTARRALLGIQPDLVRKMGLDPQIVDEIMAELKKAGAV